jgi:hypothetical protein
LSDKALSGGTLRPESPYPPFAEILPVEELEVDDTEAPGGEVLCH